MFPSTWFIDCSPAPLWRKLNPPGWLRTKPSQTHFNYWFPTFHKNTSRHGKQPELVTVGDCSWSKKRNNRNIKRAGCSSQEEVRVEPPYTTQRAARLIGGGSCYHCHFIGRISLWSTVERRLFLLIIKGGVAQYEHHPAPHTTKEHTRQCTPPKGCCCRNALVQKSITGTWPWSVVMSPFKYFITEVVWSARLFSAAEEKYTKFTFRSNVTKEYICTNSI